MNFDGQADMSSRMPWTRMWTAVQLYSVQPTEAAKSAKGYKEGVEGIDALKEMAKHPDNMDSWFDLYTHSYDNLKIWKEK